MLVPAISRRYRPSWLDVAVKLDANWSDYSKADLDQLKGKAMSVASNLKKSSAAA